MERWFGEITSKQIRRGVFKSVKDQINAIEHYIQSNIKNPKIFAWIEWVGQILEKMNHCNVRTVTARQEAKTIRHLSVASGGAKW